MIVIVTSAVEAVHGGLEIVHLSTIGPVPLTWVKVAFGVFAFGLNVPVPPLATDHVPVPADGVLPPSPAVVPRAQIVCGPPTVALGDWLIVAIAELLALHPDALVTARVNVTLPEAAAVYVIVWMLAALVMVPFEIVHA